MEKKLKSLIQIITLSLWIELTIMYLEESIEKYKAKKRKNLKGRIHKKVSPKISKSNICTTHNEKKKSVNHEHMTTSCWHKAPDPWDDDTSINYIFTCSHCGWHIGCSDGDLDYNFCPACGAQMNENINQEL